LIIIINIIITYHVYIGNLKLQTWKDLAWIYNPTAVLRVQYIVQVLLVPI
jgi:hypothetical protein